VQVQSFVDKALGRKRSIPEGLREPPRLSGGLPVLGHTVEFVRDTIGLLFRAWREHGEAASFQVAHRRMVAFFGPKAQEAVFRAKDEVASPHDAYKIMTPVFGQGLVYDAPPQMMDEQLKMLLVALKDKRMRTYGESILAEVERSIADWGDAGELDLVDYCRVLTNFTSSRCLIGKEFREGMTEEFATVYHHLERGVTPIAYINANLPLPSFRRRDQARVRLVEMIQSIIDDRRRTGRVGEDFLQTLMDARYADGRGLTGHEITGLLLASMFAGHHTSSVTTAWTLMELLRTPAFFQRLMGQLDGVYGADTPVTYQSLREITLTEYAVKEALRLHPPLFMLIRVAKQDFVHDGWHCPAGTWLVVSPTVSHHDPKVFRDPERFDPDRFAPPREEDKVDFAYIPFGGGRHKCLGNAFAILQVKAILAVLLRRYEFELSGDPIKSDFHGLVIGPAQPCRIRYRRRRRVEDRAVAPAAPQPSTLAERAAAAGCPFHAAADAPSNGHGHGDVVAATPARAEKKGLAVFLDRDLCQGHAVCVGEAPEIFCIGDDGRVAFTHDEKSLHLDEVPKELEAAVRRASQYCPTRTVRLSDED
jgi:sterol 14-demethylase